MKTKIKIDTIEGIKKVEATELDMPSKLRFFIHKSVCDGYKYTITEMTTGCAIARGKTYNHVTFEALFMLVCYKDRGIIDRIKKSPSKLFKKRKGKIIWRKI